MTFCVECGAVGPTVEGLCRADFALRHALFSAPAYIDLVRCRHCGSVNTEGGWVEVTVDALIPDLVRDRIETDPLVEGPRYTYDLRPEDERNVAVTVNASGRVGPWDLAHSFQTKVRLRGGACPTCSKRKGRYFVGTVQVRGAGRPVTEAEARRAQEIAERGAAHGGTEEFVSRTEAVPGGVDVLVSTNAFAKRLATNLARELGGTVGSSATLHTHRGGKDRYRATYVVRLPGFHEGDVILWRGSRYRVERLGNPVRLEHMTSGERIRARMRDLQRARRVEAEEQPR